MNAPPDEMVEAAEQAAEASPCAKSTRGVVTWVHLPSRILRLSSTWNGPPQPFTCLKTDECKNTCNKRCNHAETRAIRRMWQTIHVGGYSGDDFMISDVQMLHIKLDRGQGVPGGPPSCWQCSREILDAGIAGIWLWELYPEAEYSGEWKFYTPLDFHVATLRNCANDKKDPKNAELWTVEDEIQLIKIKKSGHTSE